MVQKIEVTSDRPAYFIAEFFLEDAEGIKPYSSKVPATVQPFGGEFLVREGQLYELECAILVNASRIIIRFSSMQKAKAWYYSDAYQKLIPIRQRSGKTNAYIVDGLPNNQQ